MLKGYSTKIGGVIGLLNVVLLIFAHKLSALRYLYAETYVFYGVCTFTIGAVILAAYGLYKKRWGFTAIFITLIFIDALAVLSASG